MRITREQFFRDYDELEELEKELKNAKEIRSLYDRSVHPLSAAKERMDKKIEEIELLIKSINRRYVDWGTISKVEHND